MQIVVRHDGSDEAKKGLGDADDGHREAPLLREHVPHGERDNQTGE